MAATLRKSTPYARPISHVSRAKLHSTVLHDCHADTAQVTSRGRILTVCGRKVTHELVLDFFLEEGAVILLKLLLPLLITVLAYLGLRDVPILSESKPPATNAINYCIPQDNYSTRVVPVTESNGGK